MEERHKPVIFFDWDGTLADSMDLCLGEIRLALERIGHVPVDEERIRACNGPTHEESIGVLGLDPMIGPRFLQERIRAEQELIPKLLKLYPGVEDMLYELSRVADLVIVSNGQEDYIRSSISVFGLTECFLRIQAAIPGCTKADVLSRLIEDLKPEKAILVGDRRTDIQAGIDNHLRTIAVSYGYGSPPEFAGASLVVENVDELWDVLLMECKGL
ncbi:MAG: HAD hydrolase-like protein [Clostridia bacterium]|nr:HAD hydrolase-like protein [Clostridia bacterium]